LRRVGVVADLAQTAGELRGGSEGWHSVAANQPRDRRVIHAGLLCKLTLGHLLGLELCPQPLIECSAILSSHIAWLAPRYGVEPRYWNYRREVQKREWAFGTPNKQLQDAPNG
jgi:hypothetical protein